MRFWCPVCSLLHQQRNTNKNFRINSKITDAVCSLLTSCYRMLWFWSVKCSYLMLPLGAANRQLQCDSQLLWRPVNLWIIADSSRCTEKVPFSWAAKHSRAPYMPGKALPSAYATRAFMWAVSQETSAVRSAQRGPIKISSYLMFQSFLQVRAPFYFLFHITNYVASLLEVTNSFQIVKLMLMLCTKFQQQFSTFSMALNFIRPLLVETFFFFPICDQFSCCFSSSMHCGFNCNPQHYVVKCEF